MVVAWKGCGFFDFDAPQKAPDTSRKENLPLCNPITVTKSVPSVSWGRGGRFEWK